MPLPMAFNTPPFTPGLHARSTSTVTFRGSTPRTTGLEDLLSSVGPFGHPQRNGIPPTPGTLSKIKCEEILHDGGPMTPLKRLIAEEIRADSTVIREKKTTSKNATTRLFVYRDPIETPKTVRPVPKSTTKRAMLMPVDVWDDDGIEFPVHLNNTNQDIDLSRFPLRELSGGEVTDRDHTLDALRAQVGANSTANYSGQENAFIVDSVPIDETNNIMTEQEADDALVNAFNNIQISAHDIETDVNIFNVQNGPSSTALGRHLRGAPGVSLGRAPIRPLNKTRNIVTTKPRTERPRGLNRLAANRRQAFAARANIARPSNNVNRSGRATPLFDNQANIAAGMAALAAKLEPLKEIPVPSFNILPPPPEPPKVRPYPVCQNLPADWIGRFITWEKFLQIFKDFEENCRDSDDWGVTMARQVKQLRTFWLAQDDNGEYLRKWTHFNIPKWNGILREEDLDSDEEMIDGF